MYSFPYLFFFAKFNNMKAILLLIIFLLYIICPLYKYYEPKIEIIVLIKHYRIYLRYNTWDGPCYKRRVYKYLFEI